jgi:hypothetical protein
MKTAHQKVRHVPNLRSAPGPDPSGLLPSSFPGFFRDTSLPPKSVQNPYKSDRFHKLQFFNACRSTTYNFNTLKCTDFGAVPQLSPLPRGEGQGEGQTGSPAVAPDSCKFMSTRGRGRGSNKAAQKACYTGQNETFETETARQHGVFRTNMKIFLRPVSFCPVRAARQTSASFGVPRSAAFVSIGVHSWLGIQNEKK